MARSVFTSIHSAENGEAFPKKYPREMANALFALASSSIIYSYMAIESFVNYQLYRIWEKRNSDTYENTKFNTEFLNTNDFITLQNHKSVRELKERIKLICRILGYKQIHDEDPGLWQEFTELVGVARHFLVHPFPDPVKFNETIKTIMEEKRAGFYIDVAEKTIRYLYNQANHSAPDWLQENKLLKNRGYIILVENH
jgi:hypothetical protein